MVSTSEQLPWEELTAQPVAVAPTYVRPQAEDTEVFAEGEVGLDDALNGMNLEQVIRSVQWSVPEDESLDVADDGAVDEEWFLFSDEMEEDEDEEPTVAEPAPKEPDVADVSRRRDQLQIGMETLSRKREQGAAYHAEQPTDTTEGFSDGDVDMLLKLGYEPSLRHVVDEERVEERKNAFLQDDEVGTRNTSAYVYHKVKKSELKNTKRVENEYSRELGLTCARLFGALAGMCGVLVLCMLGRWWRTQSADGSSTAFTAAILACLLATAAPQAGRLLRGLRSLVDFEPVAYAVPALAVLTAAVYDVVTLFRPLMWSDGLWINAAALGTLLTVILAELWQGKSQRISYHMVSAGKPLSVIAGQRSRGDDQKTAFGEAEVQGEASEHMGAKVRTVRSADRFFVWANRYNEAYGMLNYLLPTAMLLTVVCGGAVMMVHDDIEHGLMAALIAFVTALPCAFVLGLTCPTYRANRNLKAYGCTVLGEASAMGYTRSKMRARNEGERYLFSDRDAVHKKVTLRIAMREDEHAALYQEKTRKLLRLLDGMEALDWENSYVDTDGVHLEISELREGFLQLYMTDHGHVYEVMMGSYEELDAKGVRLPRENMERIYRRQSPDGEILYVAFDGVTRSACLVTYRVRTKFTWAFETLRRMGYTVGVLTYDPMLSARTVEGLDPEASVIYRGRFETQDVEQDGGVASVDGGIKVVYAMLACRRIRDAYAFVTALSWIMSVGGLVAVALLCLLNPALSGHPLMAVGVLLWQIAWGGVLWLIGTRQVNRTFDDIPEEGRKSAHSPKKKNNK